MLRRGQLASSAAVWTLHITHSAECNRCAEPPRAAHVQHARACRHSLNCHGSIHCVAQRKSWLEIVKHWYQELPAGHCPACKCPLRSKCFTLALVARQVLQNCPAAPFPGSQSQLQLSHIWMLGTVCRLGYAPWPELHAPAVPGVTSVSPVTPTTSVHCHGIHVWSAYRRQNPDVACGYVFCPF